MNVRGPCGMPPVMVVNPEYVLSIFTLCLRSLKKRKINRGMEGVQKE